MTVIDYELRECLKVETGKPVGRSINSDWCVNSFIMIIYENFFLVVHWTPNSDWTVKIISHRQPI